MPNVYKKIKALGATETEIFVLNDEVADARTDIRTYVRKNRDIEGVLLLKKLSYVKSYLRKVYS